MKHKRLDQSVIIESPDDAWSTPPGVACPGSLSCCCRRWARREMAAQAHQKAKDEAEKRQVKYIKFNSDYHTPADNDS